MIKARDRESNLHSLGNQLNHLISCVPVTFCPGCLQVLEQSLGRFDLAKFAVELVRRS